MNTSIQNSDNSALEKLIAEAQALLQQRAEPAAAEALEKTEDRLQEMLQKLKSGVSHLSKVGLEKAKVADTFVHDRPYVAAGIAAALGVAVGVALSRQCCSSR